MSCFLQFLDLLDKVRHFLKPSIHTGITDIGNFIEFSKSLHHPLADRQTRNFALMIVGDIIDDFFDQPVNNFLADRSFLASFLHTRNQFFLGKLFSTSIALYHHQTFVLDFFVSGKTRAAFKTLPPAAYG